MTPASDSGPLSSAITIIPGASAWVLPSSASSVSPSPAGRTRKTPATWPASKTWSGRLSPMVKKFVMSTSAEIGRSPTARSRAWSQGGEAPFATPRITRPAKIGQPLARRFSSTSTRTGQGKVPAISGTSSGRSVPRPRAARSRAMPLTPSASGRLGVTLMWITGSARPR